MGLVNHVREFVFRGFVVSVLDFLEEMVKYVIVQVEEEGVELYYVVGDMVFF